MALTAEQQQTLSNFFETMEVQTPDFSDPSAVRTAITQSTTAIGSIIKAAAPDSDLDLSQGYTPEIGELIESNMNALSTSDEFKTLEALTQIPNNGGAIALKFQKPDLYAALPNTIQNDISKLVELIQPSTVQAIITGLNEASQNNTSPNPEVEIRTLDEITQNITAEKSTPNPEIEIKTLDEITQNIANERQQKIQNASVMVEFMLGQVGEEIKQQTAAISNFIQVTTFEGTPDGTFDNHSKESLSNALSLLKMKAGIQPADGFYSTEIGEQLQTAILEDEKLWRPFAGENGTQETAKTNIELFRLQLDILQDENILYPNETAITHAKATKPGESIGAITNTLDFFNAFPILGQMLNWLVHFFTGKTMEELTGGSLKLGSSREEQIIKPGDNLDDILPKLYDKALNGGNQEEIITKIRDMAKLPIPGTGKLDEVANALEDTLAHINQLSPNVPEELRSEKFGEILANHLRNIKNGVDLDLQANTLPTFTDEQMGQIIGGPQVAEISSLRPSELTEKLDQLYKLANTYNPSQTGANTLDTNTALIVMGTNPESQNFLREAGIPEGYMIATHGTQHYIFNPEDLGMKSITEFTDFKGLKNNNNLSFAEYVWKGEGFQPQKIEVSSKKSFETTPAYKDTERTPSNNKEEYNTVASRIRIEKGELGERFKASVCDQEILQVEIDFKTDAQTVTTPNVPIPTQRPPELDMDNNNIMPLDKLAT